MKNESWTFASIMLMVLAVIVAGMAVIITQFTEYKSISPITVMLPTPPTLMIQERLANESAVYSPPMVLDAPDEIRDEVALGYEIMTHTQEYLTGRGNGRLDCSDCHFMGGMTQGGLNGGISLVGVSATYPKTDDPENLTVGLVDRTNLCIMGHMNAQPLPDESAAMSALLTYFKWISKGIPIYSDIPWLGVPNLINEHTPVASTGEQIYAQYCSTCHGSNGSSGDAPPLWGDSSYNRQADMIDDYVLAAFVQLNMPRENPILTPEQALDVAAYINSQPRPEGQSASIGD